MQAPAITTALAGIRQAERIDAARARARSTAPATEAARVAREVTIRLARPDEGGALARLAELDGRGRSLSGAPLVAVADGAIVAARGLEGGVVSDPFRAGPEVLALLDVRARQLAGGGVRAPRPRHERRSMPVLRVGGAR